MTKTSPRGYQTYIFERAREENVIAVNETGTGKTLIAVMLIEHMLAAQEQELQQDTTTSNRKIIMLTPNKILAEQQASVIKHELDLKETDVGIYLGESGVLSINSNKSQLMRQKRILVMTPQIFLHLLSHSPWMRMEDVELLIMDECHHCMENHPYKMIMRDYYHPSTWKPKVFGMTASPVNSQRTFQLMVEKKNTLEANMDSIVVTLDEKMKQELSTYVTEAKEYVKEYQNILDESLYSQLFVWLGLTTMNEDSMRAISEELGLYAIYKYLESKAPGSSELKVLESIFTFEKTVSDKVIKTFELLAELRCDNEQNFRSIVFVERRAVAKLLNILFKEHGPSFIKCEVLVGSGGDDSLSRSEQIRITKEFREGKINLIIATSVAEEGLDIQLCDLVVRFNMPRDLISHVQSRGRARVQAANYYVMRERENVEQMNRQEKIKKSEEMSLQLPSSARLGSNQVVVDRPGDEYMVASTGAKVTAANSISLLNHYCNKVGGTTNPFKDLYESIPGCIPSFRCRIVMPDTCPLPDRHFLGPPASKKMEAKRLATLKVIQALHKHGELTDQLLPKEKVITTLSPASPLENAGIKEFEKHVPSCFVKSNTIYMYRIVENGEDTGLQIGLFDAVDVSQDPIKLYVRSNTPSCITLQLKKQEILTEDREEELRKKSERLLKQINPQETTHVDHRLSIYLWADEVEHTTIYKKKYESSETYYSIVETSTPVYASDCFMGSSTYYDYYRRKYGIQIKDPQQRMVQVSHQSASNFTYFKEKKQKEAQSHTYLLPELLEKTTLSTRAYNTLYLIPSILYLLEKHIHAQEIKAKFNLSCPLDMIQTAITAPFASTTDNYERLEFIGDSVLKYLSCLHNYRLKPDEGEGNLSISKHIEVSNLNLYNLAVSNNIAGFICKDPFQKKLWRNSGNSMKIPMKTISDVVEALIGACFTHGKVSEALKFCCSFGLTIHQDEYPTVPRRELSPSREESIVLKASWLQSILPYQFSDIMLLGQACTHASISDSPNYQRLEFLGDAVLDLILSERIMTDHPDITPGELTQMRKNLVNNNALAVVATQAKLFKCLILADTQMIKDINQYVTWKITSKAEWYTRTAPKILADVVEALAGAILVDSNFDLEAAREGLEAFVQYLMSLSLPPSTEIDDQQLDDNKDFVSDLQILCQKKGLLPPKYDFREVQPGQEVTVKILGREISSARAMNKKECKKHAAKLAYIAVQKNPALLIK